MSTSEKKIKISWDDKLTELFIKICVQEVRSGNRPTTHLSKKGWINLKEKLKKLANKDFDNKQLKNKWDNLKKDWQNWRRLIGKETGLGWNATKRTIEATDEWWDAKIKEIPAASKFREKGLLFAEELSIIFCDAVATGEQAWAPSSGSLPEFYEVNSRCLEKNIENIDESEDSDSLLEKGKKQVTQSGKDKNVKGCSSSSHSIKKKSRSSSNLSKSLERISDIVESFHHKSENHSLRDCLTVVNNLGIEEKSEFYYKCLILLTKYKDARKMLLCMENPDLQLGYLTTLVNDNK